MRLGIVGATGAVGQAFLEWLPRFELDVQELRLFASPRSAGKTIPFSGQKLRVQPVGEESFRGLDLVFFSAGSSVSEQWAPIAQRKGVLVIDNSRAFRLHPSVPLVVAGVNSSDLFAHHGIIANPNCSTIQMCVALKAVQDLFGMCRIIVSTYQAASGAGAKAMDELLNQARSFNEGTNSSGNVFPHPLLMNLIPRIDALRENGYTGEEMKLVEETRKIFHSPALKISATAVRVPVLRAHSESITVEVQRSIDLEVLRKEWEKHPGIRVMDDPAKDVYPMPLYVAGEPHTFIGRLRKDLAFENGVSFWVVADQLLRGAAVNALEIAKEWKEGGPQQ